MKVLPDPGVRRGGGAAAWLGVSTLLGGLGVLGGTLPPEMLDWQPTLALAQPWRSFSAVAVHYSDAHLRVNLVGAGIVAALGWTVRITPRCCVAWLAAWPLTHIGLLLDLQLTHYGGLSGVLHAGVAIAALHTMRSAHSRQRRIGAAIGVGLLLKVALEFPWAPHAHAGLGITVAPLAHLSGLLAGLACGAVAGLLGPGASVVPHD